MLLLRVVVCQKCAMKLQEIFVFVLDETLLSRHTSYHSLQITSVQ